MADEIVITRGSSLPQVVQVARGVAGRMGLSAYDVAVVEGFEGTEAEWVASLTEAAAAAEAAALAAVAAEAVLREDGDTQGVGGFLSGTLPNPGVNTSALDNAIAAGINDPASGARAAVQARVDAAVSALLDGAPGALDTLNELAAALADDAAFSTTITNALAAKETPAGAQAKVDALGASLPATYETLTGGPDVVCWGDSMTAQGYPAYLATATGRTVRNAGVGGESAPTIAARQGAMPMLLTFPGGQIPASGGATVTLTSAGGGGVAPLLQGDGNPDGNMAGTVLDVPGTLTYSGGVYTFTRATAGAVVPATRPAPLILDFAKARRGDIAVIWVGRNPTPLTAASLARARSDIRAMVASLPHKGGFVIVGVFNGRFEGTGTTAATEIGTLAANLLADYGRRFIDLRAYAVAYGLADAGIQIRESQTADIALDIFPNGLRTDDFHPNEAGKVLIANQVAQRLYELGDIDTFTPVAFPTPVPARTALLANGSFEVNTAGWEGASSGVIARDTTVAFDGGACLKVTPTTTTASGARLISATPNRIPVAGGVALHVDMRVLPANGQILQAFLYEWSGAGALVATTAVTLTAGAGAWQLVTFDVTTNAATSNFYIQINKAAADGASVLPFYLDAVTAGV